MTQFLPPNLLALFAPRDSIPYLAPLDQLPTEKKPWLYTGVSQYLSLFEVRIQILRSSVRKRLFGIDDDVHHVTWMTTSPDYTLVDM